MNTPSDSETLNVALELSLEWGENWMQPIQGRLQTQFPNMASEEADRLNAGCSEIQNYCWDVLCQKELDGEITSKEIAILLLQRFPDISSSNVTRLINQGMYYVRK